VPGCLDDVALVNPPSRRHGRYRQRQGQEHQFVTECHQHHDAGDNPDRFADRASQHMSLNVRTPGMLPESIGLVTHVTICTYVTRATASGARTDFET
jgi:hypothetical protein